MTLDKSINLSFSSSTVKQGKLCALPTLEECCVEQIRKSCENCKLLNKYKEVLFTWQDAKYSQPS